MFPVNCILRVQLRILRHRHCSDQNRSTDYKGALVMCLRLRYIPYGATLRAAIHVIELWKQIRRNPRFKTLKILASCWLDQAAAATSRVPLV